MKARWILIALTVWLFFQNNAKAQVGEMSNPYWVIEGNVFTRDYTLMRFYDEKSRLIREERLEGRFLDLSRRRNVKMLNHRLSELVDSLSLTGKRPPRKNRKKAI